MVEEKLKTIGLGVYKISWDSEGPDLKIEKKGTQFFSHSLFVVLNLKFLHFLWASYLFRKQTDNLPSLLFSFFRMILTLFIAWTFFVHGRKPRDDSII